MRGYIQGFKMALFAFMRGGLPAVYDLINELQQEQKKLQQELNQLREENKKHYGE